MADCPSRFSLLQHQAGELPAQDNSQLAAHLTDCARCQTLVAEVRADIDHFEGNAGLHAQFEDGLQKRVRQATAAPRTPRHRWWLLGMSGALAAAAAAVLLVVVTHRPSGEGPTAGELAARESMPAEIAYRGALSWQLIAKRGQKQFPVADAQRMHAGDAMRFVVVSDRPGFLTIFSLDARHHLSSLYPAADPARDARAWPLARPGRHLLPESVVLDEATGREYFVLVFSDKAFDRKVVHARAKKRLLARGPSRLTAAALGLSGQVEVVTVYKVRQEGSP